MHVRVNTHTCTRTYKMIFLYPIEGVLRLHGPSTIKLGSCLYSFLYTILLFTLPKSFYWKIEVGEIIIR